MTTPSEPAVLRTTAGDFPLGECRLAVGGREWAVAYLTAVVTRGDEGRFLAGAAEWMPYGVALWPAAIALAHEVATRADEFRGRNLLELGTGTGLPGIVAASAGANVLQTYRSELALHVCRRNGERNGVGGVDYQLADWAAWDITQRYDWVIGSDILYADTQHVSLRHIFEANLKPGGRVLIADPFRADSLPLLRVLEADGWRVTYSKWSVGEGDDARPVAVYELTPPRQ